MLRSREVTETDRAEIAKWISVDADHAGKCDSDFWLKPEPGVKLFAIEDALGPIFYVRGESLLRLHIQFAPESERRRLARAIDEFTPLIAAGAKKNNYKQLVFESVVQPLIAFLSKRGFRASKNEFVRDL
jgi:hypothetical protein